ncbi:PLDc N-terminal domain-containing protein [Thermodesulforhabdus norvegica]|uniref:Phospholipase_D-nuclease N-terminal n=1 Tax=Thermodesulforhabdus norvegica TaxID=39841 RepID=A0A1I4QV75_9BACT|nr:PLDc N-terminal domain-containing protein [Thermodesulforhabdus norvegica]SFM43675.1 Phospholipase_D-nuclease N-terminal [Thermodesulforhabdus norvegica]
MIFKVILVLILFGLPLVPTFWAIQDIPKRQFRSFRRKFLWFFAVSTFPFFGALAYILFERKKTEPMDPFASISEALNTGEKTR